MNEIIKGYRLDWKDVLYIIVVSFLISFSFQVFLLPNDIISGGVASLSIILHELTNISPALIQYAFNIPLLILIYFFICKEFTFKSILQCIFILFFFINRMIFLVW